MLQVHQQADQHQHQAKHVAETNEKVTEQDVDSEGGGHQHGHHHIEEQDVDKEEGGHQHEHHHLANAHTEAEGEKDVGVPNVTTKPQTPPPTEIEEEGLRPPPTPLRSVHPDSDLPTILQTDLLPPTLILLPIIYLSNLSQPLSYIPKFWKIMR